MFIEYFCCQTDCFIRQKCSISPYIQRKLIKICDLANTRILYCKVYTFNRGVNGINRNHANRHIFRLILVSAHISPSLCNGQFHVKLAVSSAIQCSNHCIRIHDFNIRISLNICSRYDTFTFKLNISRFRFICFGSILDCQGFQIHDDFSYIFLNSRNGAEFMQYTVDFNLADCCTR